MHLICIFLICRLELTWIAVVEGVSSCAARANTRCPVGVDLAARALRARVGNRTRVDAVAVAANLSVGAVVV